MKPLVPGLSLDKFAKAKAAKYDKRKLLAEKRALKSKRFNAYQKVKQRLAKEGVPVDNPAVVKELPDLDEIFGTKPAAAAAHAKPARAPAEADDTAGADPHHPQHQRAKPHSSQQGHLHHQQQQQPEASDDGNILPTAARDAPAADGHSKKELRHKPPSQLQRLAAKQQQEKHTKEQQQREKQRALQERQDHLQQRQRQRQHQKHKFFQKTRRGQPVMKHRMDKILEQLQHEKAG